MLKVPARQPKRARLWLADGSCIRLRAERPNHVWSYDFVEERTHHGRKIRLLNIIDEFTYECLAIRVSRRLKSIEVTDVLSDLFILRGVPAHIRSDNGADSSPKPCRSGSAPLVRRPLTSRQAAHGRTASSRVSRRGCVTNYSSEVFYTLREAQIIVESWRRHYNTVRPHA